MLLSLTIAKATTITRSHLAVTITVTLLEVIGAEEEVEEGVEAEGLIVEEGDAVVEAVTAKANQPLQVVKTGGSCPLNPVRRLQQTHTMLVKV
jgi:hypothetical protein